MKTTHLALTAIALAALSLSAAPVYAEEAPTPPPAEAPGHDGPPPADMKDGPKGDKRAEFEKRGKEMFEKNDTDKDGFLSKAEMEASQKARLDEMFEKTDLNKDGKLSPEELQKGREAMRDKYRAKFKDKEHRAGKEGLKDGPADKPKPAEPKAE